MLQKVVHYIKKAADKQWLEIECDPAGTRTQGPNIKSVVLYQLSYEIMHSVFGSAKIVEYKCPPNFLPINSS